jgi:hypothetical protein
LNFANDIFFLLEVAARRAPFTRSTHSTVRAAQV